MSKKNIIDNAKDKIASGNLSLAIENLHVWFKEKENTIRLKKEWQQLQNELCIQSNRLYKLNKKKDKDLIEEKKADIKLNKISNATLNIIDKMEYLDNSQNVNRRIIILNRYLWLIIVVLLVTVLACIGAFWFFSTNTNDKLKEIEYKIQNKPSSIIELDTLYNQNGLKEIVQQDKRIAQLEYFKDTLINSLNSAKWIFGFILTLVGLVVAYNRYLVHKRQEEEKKKIDVHLQKLQESNDRLFKKSEANITSVTNLINSYQNLFKIAQDARTILERTKVLENQTEEWDNRRKSEIERVKNESNALSIELIGKNNRNNYKNISFKNRLARFASDFISLSQDEDINKEFNSNCYLLVALHFMTDVLFGDAIEYLEKAIELSRKEDNEKTSLLDCLFHAAIIYYNFSFYNLALPMFKEAVGMDNEDTFIRTYLPEARHLQWLQSVKLNKNENGKIPDNVDKELRIEQQLIEQEFESVIEKIKKINFSSTVDLGFKNRMLAIAYIKYGNFHYRVPEKKMNDYGKFLSPLKSAREKYMLAHEIDDKFYLSKFSCAQVVMVNHFLLGKEESNEEITTSKIYLEEVYREVRRKAGETTEGKISMMYYYILSICELFLQKLDSEYRPIDFYDEMLESQKILPLPLVKENRQEEIRIFSPHSKKDLTVSELINELEILKTW